MFGQGTCRFREKFDLTLGLRYEYQDAEMKWTLKGFPGPRRRSSTLVVSFRRKRF